MKHCQINIKGNLKNLEQGGKFMTINLCKEKLRDLYYYMTLTRKVDEKICELYKEGDMQEKPISGIGQEATSVGATLALLDKDYVMPSLRTRGAFLTKGMTPEEILIETYKKVGAKSQGRWTAHHAGDMDKGILLGSAIVSSSVTVATGTALASKITKSDRVTLAFFGDGASSRGDIHASMNFAAVRNLPIIFICENNSWALGTTSLKQMKNQDIADRAIGYGIPGEIVDGQDIIEVFLATQKAVHRARRGDGPTLIECKTYHFRGHSESHDPDDNRPKEELEYWRNRCPVGILRKNLLKDSRITLDDMVDIDNEIDSEIEKAVQKVRNLPDVDSSVEEIIKYVYS